MQEFEDFLASIHFQPNPYRNFDNSLPTSLDLTGFVSAGRFSPAGTPLPTGNPVVGLNRYVSAALDDPFRCATCHTLPTGMGADVRLSGFQYQFIAPGMDGEHHHALVSVDGSTQKAIKVPQTRNVLEKTGFSLTSTRSLSGFGLLARREHPRRRVVPLVTRLLVRERPGPGEHGRVPALPDGLRAAVGRDQHAAQPARHCLAGLARRRGHADDARGALHRAGRPDRAHRGHDRGGRRRARRARREGARRGRAAGLRAAAAERRSGRPLPRGPRGRDDHRAGPPGPRGARRRVDVHGRDCAAPRSASGSTATATGRSTATSSTRAATRPIPRASPRSGRATARRRSPTRPASPRPSRPSAATSPPRTSCTSTRASCPSAAPATCSTR